MDSPQIRKHCPMLAIDWGEKTNLKSREAEKYSSSVPMISICVTLLIK